MNPRAQIALRAALAAALILAAWHCTERDARAACAGNERCIAASL